MPGPLITLTTDFGEGSPYVAAMKGVILSLNPAARLVDISHRIAPQNVLEASWVLDDVIDFFPCETIHVVVVDPGVGTERRLVYARWNNAHFLAPDNGLLGRLAERSPPRTIRSLTQSQWWLTNVSRTFHGRDILAPVGAHLSLGVDPRLFGPPLDSLVSLPWPEVLVVPGKIQGTVRSIDSFGNLITDIAADKLHDVPRTESTRVGCDEHETLGIQQTYGDQPPMTLIALVGSSGYLELSIVNDNAAEMLGIRPGAPVLVQW